MNFSLWPLRALRCSRRSCLALTAVVLGILMLARGTSAAGQSVERLSQVKKVYLEDLGGESHAIRLRERLIERLRHKAKLDVVGAANAADAVFKIDASIWRTGYLSTDPRSPANLRQAQYRGFLSVEVLGKNNEPLWSYLVTPSRFRRGDIASNLADQLVTRLVYAMSESEVAQAAPPAESAGHVVLTAAGATFPAPLYQKWFETFEERHPNVRVKYDAVGSGAGIERLAAGQLDFAASDMPLSDSQMAKLKKRFLHLPRSSALWFLSITCRKLIKA